MVPNKRQTNRFNLTQGWTPRKWHQIITGRIVPTSLKDDRHWPNTGRPGTDRTPGCKALTSYSDNRHQCREWDKMRRSHTRMTGTALADRMTGTDLVAGTTGTDLADYKTRTDLIQGWERLAQHWDERGWPYTMTQKLQWKQNANPILRKSLIQRNAKKTNQRYR